MSTAEFPIAKIIIGRRLREADPDLVEAYKQSILEREARGQRGLIQPIELCAATKKGFAELVDGLHRLAAYKALGRATIPADMHPAMSPVERQMAEIDAQILHAGLAPLDKAAFLAKRKALYERIHPETRAGVAGGKARQGSATEIISFADEAAVKLDCTARTVRNSVFIAEHLTKKAAVVFGTTPAARKFTEALALAKLDPEIQLKVAKRIADPDAPEKSVAAARAWAEGGVAPTAAQKAYNAAVAAWKRMTAAEKRQYYAFLAEEPAPSGWVGPKKAPK